MATFRKPMDKKPPMKKPAKKEVKHITPELIFAVLSGDFGAPGKERNAKLRKEGFSPSAVTKKIKDLEKLAEEFAPVKEKAGDYFGCLLCMLVK